MEMQLLMVQMIFLHRLWAGEQVQITVLCKSVGPDLQQQQIWPTGAAEV